ncbi:hypothetical protein [Bosea sp. BK604]|uniref:2'-5' RNA ligase family protein n=1 Tax=Bosea sp. BK604 TaxID=2512180 RepID=UPI001043E378|nr:hypothetical protein [Bosea sp. BK604]TCR68609.1 hypothetical protein EV560_102438 [Bosea sp. BK604]
MPTDVRSIWLMPKNDDEAFLSSLVRELAGRFGTPVFTPHLTLRGDTDVPANKLAEDIAAAASQVPAFAEPISAIETTEAFFRAFYARFAVSAPLATLKRGLDPHAADPFMPHVSLLYGNLEADVKAPAAAEFGQRLAGRAIGFDRICVVRSGQDVPIADWSILATAPLKRL